jgi:hypothetical protein
MRLARDLAPSARSVKRSSSAGGKRFAGLAKTVHDRNQSRTTEGLILTHKADCRVERNHGSFELLDVKALQKASVE